MRRGRKRIKVSKWCADCLADGKRRQALKRPAGYDAYCREHKAARAKAWMKARRAVDPGYGEPGGRHWNRYL